ncbi:hypothetical protein [Flavobacterium aquariorum]|uniref:hypothetical protein n=1 Tax=Flavobacterium aquariorum TaxID=2217670 RepID=UPI000F4F9873|nr:hypothetical protein [Flavobacterium aquariorum]
MSEARKKQSEARLTLSEDHLMQSEDRIRQSEAYNRESEARIRLSEDRIRHSEARIRAFFSLRMPNFTERSIKTVEITKIQPLQDCEYYFLSLRERIKRGKS